MKKPLTNPQIKKLKGHAQRLEPVLRVGKEGVTDAFLASVNDALARHELIKIKFAGHKEEKRELAPLIAGKTSSFLVTQIGNVAVFYKIHTDPAKRLLSAED